MTHPEERREPITNLADVRADHNVVAAFGSIEDARDAITSLEAAGIPADSIALLGAFPPESARPGEEIVEDAAVGTFGKGAAEGAAAGAVGGAAVGALTSLVIPGVGPVLAAGLWALGGAAGGLAVGGTAATGGSPAWRATFDVVDSGNFAVGVHDDDPQVVDEGQEVLTSKEPLSINRFSDAGAPEAT